MKPPTDMCRCLGDFRFAGITENGELRVTTENMEFWTKAVC